MVYQVQELIVIYIYNLANKLVYIDNIDTQKEFLYKIFYLEKKLIASSLVFQVFKILLKTKFTLPGMVLKLYDYKNYNL